MNHEAKMAISRAIEDNEGMDDRSHPGGYRHISTSRGRICKQNCSNSSRGKSIGQYFATLPVGLSKHGQLKVRVDLTLSPPDPRENHKDIPFHCSVFLSAFLKRAHQVHDDRAVKHVSTPKSDRATARNANENFAHLPELT